METEKIKVNIKTEIHFYSYLDKIAILLKNNSDEKDKKFGEILLFSLYSFRVGVNCRDTERVGYSLKSFVEDVLRNTIPPSLEKIYNFDPKEGEGERIFRVPLVFDESTGEFYFTMKPKGFGFLNLGGDIYAFAQISVWALFYYLYLARKDDKDYIEKLIKTALLCAKVLEYRGVNVFNQHERALIIAFLVFEEGTNK